MKPTLLSSDVERFRAAIAGRLALWFDDDKLDQLANLLERRLASVDREVSGYLRELEAATGHAELRELARQLTVGETYFFRHAEQFRAFSQVALPDRIAARAESQQLSLLSAACSSGEEAYSLSILTQQGLPDASWTVSITGIDVNPDALERALRAHYSAWSLRETPKDLRERYFTADGRDYVLAKAVQETVEFREENLIGAEPWPPGSLDVVFCRNVLMYFRPETAARVVRKLALGLASGGYLFLGSAETLRGLSEDFELRHTHGTFYYQRKGPRALSSASVHRSSTRLVQQMPAEPLDWTREWLTTVARSSARVRELATESANEAANCVGAPAPDLSSALELLGRERFSEALAALESLPPHAAQNADAVLLRAALLTHSGRLPDAELACAELLALDGLSPGAHYLQALCRERRGDARAAVERAQIASYLDPGFAMPHLHLGLMARRTGDRSTAQRELSQAALLLQREDAARLLLFGGGFDRNGLIALCRSELVQLGERQ